MQYIKNFTKERSSKIGASDISKLIQHPEKTESLYGYDETALTLWQEKTGRKIRDAAGFSADMGNFLEPMVLRKWITENVDDKTAKDFYRGYMLCELDKTDDGYPNAESFQNTNFLHHTKAETDFAVAHADLLGFEVDPFKEPFKKYTIIEAKTATYWSAQRKDDIYSGYDIALKKHQGIPLKHYYQVQFQMAIYQEVYGIKIDTSFLALLFDTSQFHQWEIRSGTKIQERLLELASYMKKCIDNDTPPKMLAMNQDDIKIMYPKLEEDFRIISGDELTDAMSAIEQQKQASEQLKAWTQKKQDAENTLSIFLKDSKTLKGIVNGEIVNLATWQERSGGERVSGLKEIKEFPEIENMLREKGLVKQSEGSRSVVVKFK